MTSKTAKATVTKKPKAARAPAKKAAARTTKPSKPAPARAKVEAPVELGTPRLRSTDWKPSLEDPLIRQYVLDHAGEYGVKLAEMIHKRQPITGVEIIDSIPDDKPSNIRKVLYKLEESRVAEYEKDTDKSGWETFTWRLSLNEVKYVINNQRKERLRSLTAQLDFEASTQFYHCANAHMRMPFDEAADQNFKCPHCSEAMDFVDNKDEIERLKQEIRDLEAITFDV